MLLFTLASHPLFSRPIDEWRPRSLQTIPIDLVRVEDRFYGVGHNGNILHSADGIQWSEQVISAIDEFQGIAYGNQTFVSVGKRGAVWNSTDGTNWRRQESGATNDFSGVAFGTNRFVAIVTDGEILTSIDGARWEKTLARSKRTSAVTYFNGRFVVMRDLDVLTSSNGQQWTTNYTQTLAAFEFLAKAENRLVAAEPIGFIISTNGTSWTRTFSFFNDPSLRTTINDLTYANGLFLATAVRTSGSVRTPLIMISPNGVNWTFPAPPVSDRLLTTAPSTGISLMVVDSSNIRWTSANGVAWTPVPSDRINDFSAIAFGNNIFVAVGNTRPMGRAPDYFPLVAISADGLRWSRSEINLPGIGSLSDIVFASGSFAALSSSQLPSQENNSRPTPARLLLSPNGLNWSVHTLDTNRQYLSISYGPDKYLAMTRDQDGVTYRLLASPNTLEWTQLGPSHTNMVSGARAVFVNETYFIVGRQASPGAWLILRSKDGLTWTRQTGEPSAGLVTDLVFGNDRYIATGTNPSTGFGNLAFSLVSTNGMEWKPQSASLNSGGLSRVAFANGFFAAAGVLPILASPGLSPSTLWTSTDGESWKSQRLVNAPLAGMASDGRTFVAVGSAGTIWQSGYTAVGVAGPPLSIGSIGDVTVRLSIAGIALSEAIVETSLDLRSWTEWQRLMLRDGTIETTAGVTNTVQFFRLRLPTQ